MSARPEPSASTTLAQRLGIPRDAMIRAQAGVRHALQELASDGHCAAEQTQLVETASTLLEIGPNPTFMSPGTIRAQRL